MDWLKIKRRGGFAGLDAGAEINVDHLSDTDRQAVDRLFAAKGPFPRSPGADRFEFVLTRETEAGTKRLTVPEHLVPSAIARAVKDRLPDG